MTTNLFLLRFFIVTKVSQRQAIMLALVIPILISCGGGGGGGVPGPGSPAANFGGGNGGSGIVVLRLPTANKPGNFAVAPGTNTVATTGDCTVATFSVSGTITL